MAQPSRLPPHARAAMTLLVLPLTASLAGQTGQAPTADEAAVRAVVASYVEARERRDPAAIGALFTADADQVNSSGDWRRGREGIVKGTLESSQRNGGSRRIDLLRTGRRRPVPWPWRGASPEWAA